MVGSVIFALTIKDRILMEQRPLKDSYFPGKWVIPGGKPHAGEHVIDTLRREMKEELGCRPVVFMDLSPFIDQTLYYVHEGDPNFLVVPFVVLNWEGNVPEKVLDTGHPLAWSEYYQVEASDAGFTRVVGQTIERLAANGWRAP